MGGSRRITWLVFIVGVVAVVDVLGWVTWQVLRLEREQADARAEAARQAAIGRALWRMDSIVLPLLAIEGARPYFDYQAFYAANRPLDQMWDAPRADDVLVPSPLLGEPGDFVLLHFERDAGGRLASPQSPQTERTRAAAIASGVPAPLMAMADIRLYELDRIQGGGGVLLGRGREGVGVPEAMDEDQAERNRAGMSVGFGVDQNLDAAEVWATRDEAERGAHGDRATARDQGTWQLAEAGNERPDAQREGLRLEDSQHRLPQHQAARREEVLQQSAQGDGSQRRMDAASAGLSVPGSEVSAGVPVVLESTTSANRELQDSRIVSNTVLGSNEPSASSVPGATARSANEQSAAATGATRLGSVPVSSSAAESPPTSAPGAGGTGKPPAEPRPDYAQDYEFRQQAAENAQFYSDAGRANRQRGFDQRAAAGGAGGDGQAVPAQAVPAQAAPAQGDPAVVSSPAPASSTTTGAAAPPAALPTPVAANERGDLSNRRGDGVAPMQHDTGSGVVVGTNATGTDGRVRERTGTDAEPASAGRVGESQSRSSERASGAIGNFTEAAANSSVSSAALEAGDESSMLRRVMAQLDQLRLEQTRGAEDGRVLHIQTLNPEASPAGSLLDDGSFDLRSGVLTPRDPNAMGGAVGEALQGRCEAESGSTLATASNTSGTLSFSEAAPVPGDSRVPPATDPMRGGTSWDRAVDALSRERLPQSPVDAGRLTPVWIHGDGPSEPALVLVRAARVGTEVREQGVWIDWASLRRALESSVADLFPLAEVRPLLDTPVGAGTSAQRLATIPAVLIPGPAGQGILPTRSAGWSATHWTLLVGWLAVGAGVVAIGVVLRKAIELGERRGRFVSAVTHELRTPLTTFRLYSQMLAGGQIADEGKRQKYAQTLDRESQRLSGIVESVLEYARLGRRTSIGAGGSGVAHTRIEAAALLERVLPTLAGRAERAGMTLVPPAEAPACRVDVDADKVERILLNLVDNACKYAGEGADKRILLGARVEGDGRERRLVLSVRDFGPGVPESERPRIFRAFHRAKHHDASASPGLGLGLAIARGLAREMGGDLRLVGQDGAGAEFEVGLPVG